MRYKQVFKLREQETISEQHYTIVKEMWKLLTEINIYKC